MLLALADVKKECWDIFSDRQSCAQTGPRSAARLVAITTVWAGPISAVPDPTRLATDDPLLFFRLAILHMMEFVLFQCTQ